MDSPEFLTVPELAELLRIKERKVYDLASSGEVPCSRATGKLLFPADEVRAWIGASKSGSPRQRPRVFLGSHDPLLDWAIRQSHCGLATFFEASLDGLSRFGEGEGIATGLHLHDAASKEWNVAAAKQIAQSLDAVLIHWANRARGLVVRASEATEILSISDLKGRRVVPRQPSAGSDQLFREALQRNGVDIAELDLLDPALSEQDAVMSVLQGDADAAFGLQAVARPFGLSFVPVIDETFDLLIHRRAWFEPELQRLFAFTFGAEFRSHAEKLGGYDLSKHGQVRWNA